MKKMLCTGTAVLLLMLLLAGCGGPKLPDGMKAEDLETNAKALITAFNNQEYDVVVSLYSPSGPSAEAWQKQAGDIHTQLGGFKEFKKTTFTTLEDAQYGELVVVLVEAKYANASIVWKVSFTKDMEIVGMVTS